MQLIWQKENVLMLLVFYCLNRSRLSQRFCLYVAVIHTHQKLISVSVNVHRTGWVNTKFGDPPASYTTANLLF